MRKTLRTLTIAMWICAVLATVTVLAAYLRFREESRTNARAVATATDRLPGDLPPAPVDITQRIAPVPAFELKDENEQTVTQASLLGKPWVAAFIFTNCQGACPAMSGHMAALQKKIDNKDVKLVSFTLDPARDTPAVLKAYAKKFDADPARWFFLRGSYEQMQTLARDMKIATADPLPGSDQILHSSKFLLIDKTNTIRGIYDGTSAATLDTLAKDAETLARE
jgi:protein SCO1/2